MPIHVAINGYGNLGKGVEAAIKQNPDMKLNCVFTRRNPSTIKLQTENVPVYHLDEALSYNDQIDVMILCGGSATDLPDQTPRFAEYFHVIDSFDTHARIPEHMARVDMAARKGKKLAIISVGWDPGMFSLARAFGGALLPDGVDYTFWGKGVSQGHSDAIRRVDGVANGVQYTIPKEAALEAARSGKDPKLSTKEKHLRECFVVAKDGADKNRIADEIKNMPNYFSNYETVVHFISQEELMRDHAGIPHGGTVIRSGKTGGGDQVNRQVIEYNLQLESNPEFTASVLIAYARAAVRIAARGTIGCLTAFDVAPVDLSIIDRDEMLRTLL